MWHHLNAETHDHIASSPCGHPLCKWLMVLDGHKKACRSCCKRVLSPAEAAHLTTLDAQLHPLCPNQPAKGCGGRCKVIHGDLRGHLNRRFTAGSQPSAA